AKKRSNGPPPKGLGPSTYSKCHRAVREFCSFRFCSLDRRRRCNSCDGSELFAPGVTSKFAQIFLRDDKDLTGKRSRDLKKAYVTSVFGIRFVSKNRVSLCNYGPSER